MNAFLSLPNHSAPFLLIGLFLLLSCETLCLIPRLIIIAYSSLHSSLLFVIHLTCVASSFCYLFRNFHTYKHASTIHYHHYLCCMLVPLRVTQNILGNDLSLKNNHLPSCDRRHDTNGIVHAQSLLLISL